MNWKTVIFVAKWLGCSLAYLLLSPFFSLAFVISLMRWNYGDDDSAALGLVMLMFLVPFFAVCVLWGIIYVSAFVKASQLGGAIRIWRHLGMSWFLGLLGIAILEGALGHRFPDFGSKLAIDTYLFLALSSPLVCIVAGILIRVRLSSPMRRMLKPVHAGNTDS